MRRPVAYTRLLTLAALQADVITTSTSSVRMRQVGAVCGLPVNLTTTETL